MSSRVAAAVPARACACSARSDYWRRVKAASMFSRVIKCPWELVPYMMTTAVGRITAGPEAFGVAPTSLVCLLCDDASWPSSHPACAFRSMTYSSPTISPAHSSPRHSDPANSFHVMKDPSCIRLALVCPPANRFCPLPPLACPLKLLKRKTQPKSVERLQELRLLLVLKVEAA